MRKAPYTLNEIVTFEEDERHEFKGYEEVIKRRSKDLIREILEDAEECICAFLNTHPGILYLGIEDDGRVSGIQLNREQRDDFKKRVSQVVHLSFSPSVEPNLYNIDFTPVLGAALDSFVIQISVEKGAEPVYWLKGKAFLRQKAGNFPMSPDMIERRLRQDAIKRLDKNDQPIPQKPQLPPKQTPTPPSKPAKSVSFGRLILIGSLICTGLFCFGIVMSGVFSATSPRKPPTQATGPTTSVQAASLQETATPESTPTQQPTNTLMPKPTDTATPTNTAVVPPTNAPTPPTDTPLPAAPVKGTGDVMMVDNWEIRVERIEFAEKLSAFDRIEKAAGRFAIVFLIVTNRGLSPDTFVPFGTIEIRDGEGRPYEDHAVAGSMAQYEYKADIGADINPDETVHVVAVWDIPKRSDNYTLASGTLADSSTGVIRLAIP